MRNRVAMISVHGCPLGRLGSKETGGMNVYVRELTTELARAGWQIDVFTRLTDPRQPRIEPMAPGARVVRLSAGTPEQVDKNEVLNLLPEFVEGAVRFQKEAGVSYHLVHSHYWLSSWVGARLARRWGVPHMTMFHTLGEVKNRCGAPGQESPTRIEVERASVATADRVVAASRDEVGHLVNLYGADPERIAVIPCGVNADLFRPVDKAWARRQLGLDDRWTALFVGRMDPLKGLDLLLEAVHLLRARGVHLRLLVVGGDAAPESEEARLRARVVDLGLRDAVEFVGAVSQERLPALYSAADVSVVPSFYESFGLVAVEALACGTPVIASRVGGLPDIVRHDHNGLLVDRRSAQRFADSLAYLYENEEVRQGLASRARASVLPLVWEAIARRVQVTYRTLLPGTPRPAPAAAAPAARCHGLAGPSPVGCCTGGG